MKKVYIIRHGQTYLNHYNKVQGWTDTPLTPKGTDEAEKIGEKLKDIPFDVAVSSDLRRAIVTRDIIMKHNFNSDKARKIDTEYFREEYYGSLEAIDTDVAWRLIGSNHGYTDRYKMFENESLGTLEDWIKETDPYHDAENAEEYWLRVNKGMKLLTDLSDAENILLVTHGFTIRNLWSKYGKDISLVPGPQNGSVSLMTISDDGDIKIEDKIWTQKNKMS